MAKRSERPRRLEPVDGGAPRRLAGDDLYAWATLQEQARSLQQQIMGFIQMQAQELGFDPQQETLDPAGYVRPIQRQPAQIQGERGDPPADEGQGG